MSFVSGLVFIALLLFLTPLFHKPVSEKHPYGYFQIESIFVIIKGVMMSSVTMGVLASVIESALSGGNPVNNAQISIFQFLLGMASIVIYIIMRKLNKNLSSPTITAELLGWKLDIIYSLGMSFAFFMSLYLKRTPLSFIDSNLFSNRNREYGCSRFANALKIVNQKAKENYQECTCELILVPLKEKGLLFNNVYIWASKEERKKMAINKESKRPH